MVELVVGGGYLVGGWRRHAGRENSPGMGRKREEWPAEVVSSRDRERDGETETSRNHIGSLVECYFHLLSGRKRFSAARQGILLGEQGIGE